MLLAIACFSCLAIDEGDRAAFPIGGSRRVAPLCSPNTTHTALRNETRQLSCMLPPNSHFQWSFSAQEEGLAVQMQLSKLTVGSGIELELRSGMQMIAQLDSGGHLQAPSSYKVQYSGTCAPGTEISTATDCRAVAAASAGAWTFVASISRPGFPTGCFFVPSDLHLVYNSHSSQDCGLSSCACICKKTATFNASSATFSTPPLVWVPPVIADLQTGPVATVTVFEMAYSAVPILNAQQLCNSSFVVDGFPVGDMNGLYIRDTTRRVGGEATFWDVLRRRYFFWCSSTLSFAVAPSDTWELNRGDGEYGYFGIVAKTDQRGSIDAASWSIWNGSSCCVCGLHMHRRVPGLRPSIQTRCRGVSGGAAIRGRGHCSA